MMDLVNTFHHLLTLKHFGMLKFLLLWSVIVVCYFCWVAMSHGSYNKRASVHDEEEGTLSTTEHLTNNAMHWTNNANHWTNNATHWTNNATHWTNNANHWTNNATHWKNNATHWTNNATHWTNKTSTVSSVSKLILNQGSAPFFHNYGSLNCSELLRRVRKPPIPSSQEYYCDMMDWCQNEASARFSHDDTLCECLPSGLHGRVLHSITDLLGVTWQQMNAYVGQVMLPGGHWRPADCITRRRVAVIIPYRDRERHLRMMLTHIHPILQRQQLEYRIFVIEQGKPFTFNKGSLLNIGFLESQKVFDADCILLLDVDTLPERDDNMIICGKQPVHWAGFVNRSAYAFISWQLGGAMLVTVSQYSALNGHSNVYWGWGGEDNNFVHRMRAKKMRLYTGARNISHFTLVAHTRDTGFKKNSNRFYMNKAGKKRGLHAADGINTVKYDVISYQNYTLYTWIHVDLKEIDLSPLQKTDNRMFHLCKQLQMLAFKKSDIYRSYDSCCYHNRSADQPTNQLRFFKSPITCEHMCQNLTTCLAFLYSQPTNGDNYCTLLTDICTLIPCDLIDSDVRTQIHIPEKYTSKFHIPGTKLRHLNEIID